MAMLQTMLGSTFSNMLQDFFDVPDVIPGTFTVLNEANTAFTVPFIVLNRNNAPITISDIALNEANDPFTLS